MSRRYDFAIDARMPTVDETTVSIESRVQPGVFLLEVVTASGRAAAVTFRIRREEVEIWHHDHCSAVFVRDELRAWLGDTDGRRRPLAVDEVAFSMDHLVDDTGRVAISLPDVMVWTIDPHSLHTLRQLI